jgi:P-type Ca2+ transporter type 2C
VVLEAGGVVPADGRLLETANLRVQEAALTGESEPVEKDPTALTAADLALGDRHNMVYRGTAVAYGRGLSVVTATGMDTELGRIAAMLHAVDREPTPLQRRLDQLGRGLALAALALVGVVFSLGLMRGEPLQVLLLTAISLAVAAVPEGLPAVVTVALALGAQRMLRRRALVRRLSAVEGLGSVTVVCSDKTGTLTENRMRVAAVEVAGRRVELTAGPPGSVDRALGDEPALALLLAGGALASDAVAEPDPAEPEGVRVVGDPTEAALVLAAARCGLDKAELEPALPRLAEAPFDAERKRMTTVHARAEAPGAPAAASWWPAGAPCVVFSKGAVDGLLDVCGGVWADGSVRPLDATWRERIAAANDRLAGEGMRVLGLAFRPLPSAPDAAIPPAELERDLVFVGLFGMIDPPRPEACEAVRVARRAGIRPVMITGDHPLTARAIAGTLGIADDGRALTGPELDRLSPDELAEQVGRVSVYARVSPEHKLAIVRALQRRRELVAMTGDGVNDAPALKQADIGVAMGITGTDVSKEAADIVLLDDNFATIIAAIEQGRVIFDNIRKFIKFMLTTNSAELAVMLLAPLLGMPLPLLPLQILWVNLVTDGPPALALGFEPAERGTMRRPPRQPDESIFGGGLGRHVLWVGLLMAAVSLGPAFWSWRAGLDTWQTLAFTTLVFAQMAHVLAIRSGQDSLFRMGLLSNRPLLGAVLLTIAAQLAVVYLPALQEIFGTLPLSAGELARWSWRSGSVGDPSGPDGVQLVNLAHAERRNGMDAS